MGREFRIYIAARGLLQIEYVAKRNITNIQIFHTEIYKN